MNRARTRNEPNPLLGLQPLLISGNNNIGSGQLLAFADANRLILSVRTEDGTVNLVFRPDCAARLVGVISKQLQEWPDAEIPVQRKPRRRPLTG